MLLLTTVLPSVVFRGSCDLEGVDFSVLDHLIRLKRDRKNLWVFSFNFYSE